MTNDGARLVRLGATVLIGLLAAPTALGAEYWLESPPQDSRADAVALTRSASDEGFKARVVRRYRQGEGWQFLLRVEGFEEEAPAREAARAIAARIGLPVSVYGKDGDQARAVDLAEPGEEGAPEPLAEGDPADAEAILARASRAHGGPTSGLAALRAADSVVFRFRRTLPDGLVVDHTWARRGTDRHLRIDVVEGQGRSSRAIVGAEEAWLAVDDGAFETTDRARAEETLARFDPEQVLPFVLVFAEAIENRRELERMEVAGTGEVDGRPALVLRYDGDRTSGPMTLLVDRERFHVVEVSFEDGELVHRYDGWKEQAGLVFPTRVRTWRGGELADTVQIQALSVGESPPKDWFEPE